MKGACLSNPFVELGWHYMSTSESVDWKRFTVTLMCRWLLANSIFQIRLVRILRVLSNSSSIGDLIFSVQIIWSLELVGSIGESNYQRL